MQLTFSGHPTAPARKHRVSRSPEHGQLARPGGVVRSCGATRVLGPQTVPIEGGYVAQKSEVAQSADSQYFCVQPFGFGQRDQLVRHDCYTHTQYTSMEDTAENVTNLSGRVQLARLRRSNVRAFSAGA